MSHDTHSVPPAPHIQRLDHHFEVIPHAVIFTPDLSDGAKVLYMVLSKYANQSGECWPSRARLASDVGKSRDTVDRYIRELQAVGALVVHTRHRDDGSNYTNLYTVIKAIPQNEGAASVRLGEGTGAAVNTTHKNTTHSVPPSTDVEDVSPARSASGTHNPSNDPISATFARSKQRRALVDAVVHLAHCKTEPDNPDAAEAAIDTLYYLLVETFGDDDGIGHLIYDRDWTPPRKAVSRLEAGTWLNKLLNTWQEDVGPLTWPAV